MKTSTLLGILLLGSITLNVFLWLDSDEEKRECYVTVGFERQTSIESERALDFERQYKDRLADPDSITGGIITRSALDEILCTRDCNAVTYTFGRDSEGKTGPGGNGVFVIFSGVNVTYDESSGKITEIKDLGINRYVTQHWCPPTCTPY